MARVIGVPKATGGGGVIAGITVLGVQEALIKLGLVNKVARIELGALAHQAGIFTEAQALANVPVVTGNLKSSIKLNHTGPYSWAVSASSLEGSDPAGIGKNNKEYAAFVEFGTSKMAPRFFMTQAYRAMIPLANESLWEIARHLERL